MSSGDLALQGVTRHQAGNYTCTASNVEGDGDSNIVELKVMCKYSYSMIYCFQTDLSDASRALNYVQLLDVCILHLF